MAIQRVLVAVDFSSCAERVARRAGELALQLGARLSLLHVVRRPEVPLESMMPTDDGRAVTTGEYLVRSAERRLVRYAELVEGHAVAPRVVVRFGDPVATILDEARACSAELLVVGTRARTGLARMIHGSVAAEVLREAEIPVVTVRSQWSPSCAARNCNACVEQHSHEEARVAVEADG